MQAALPGYIARYMYLQCNYIMEDSTPGLSVCIFQPLRPDKPQLRERIKELTSEQVRHTLILIKLSLKSHQFKQLLGFSRGSRGASEDLLECRKHAHTCHMCSSLYAAVMT